MTVHNGFVYAPGAGGVVHVLNASTGADRTGCDGPPAFANGVVYAAGCNSIGAYDAGTGAVLWSVSVSQQPRGLSIAGGVL